MDQLELLNRFKHHPPTEEKIGLHVGVREESARLAEYLNAILPEGREKSLAITKLEEVTYWANASIAREGTL